MTTTHILGFPRIGVRRELKFAQEQFWRGEIDTTQLQQVGRELRARHWSQQRAAGLSLLSVGDFHWYDQVLSTLALLGALPGRFGLDARNITLADYFACARGTLGQHAMEMTKWFDSNYHYLVPEWHTNTRFEGGVDWLFDEISEAREFGLPLKAVLLGPVSLLHLGKTRGAALDRLLLLPALLKAYSTLLQRLTAAGVEWVQIDEPILALDLTPDWLDAIQHSYQTLGPQAKLLLTTYFDDVSQHAARLCALPVAGIHLDLVRAPQQLAAFAAIWPQDKVLSAGVIDGRNIWRADLNALQASLLPLKQTLGERVWLASSCSLQHVPVDLGAETTLDPEIKSWLAFAVQKLGELRLLRDALDAPDSVIDELALQRAAIQSRCQSQRVHVALVQQRLAAIQPGDDSRHAPYPQRAQLQQQRFALPLLPTTSIGSFPQTAAIRQQRAAFKRGELGSVAYLQAMRDEIELAVNKQEQLGLDVLVHGEAERNDMVEYFGELLWGYAFTGNGWVQSYGSRCVKPPIIYGDVYRPEPMTVDWTRYAQSLTKKPMKGMLTGPVTMLQWSFVRDDQPRETTALQIALALRDEVRDLEKAGIGIIQIDEPAFREGLPLKRQDWATYLDWAARAFRLSSGGIDDSTQIHTHMCYSEFNDILPAIAAMDADVITIETSRSNMELLDAFSQFAYPNEIGPGVYDIHSPRIPACDEMLKLLRRALALIPARRLWVNPDCGLKTRNWAETEAALKHMVAAAQLLRGELQRQAEVEAVA